MADLAEEVTLLFKLSQVGLVLGVSPVYQDGVEEFGCTGQLVKPGLAHLTIGTSAKGCVMKEMVVLIAKGLPLCLKGHCMKCIEAL